MTTERRPVSAAREAEIRGHAARFTSPYAWKPDASQIRDLIALLDHERSLRLLAECALQDCQSESGLHEAGVREGVAKALSVLKEQADSQIPPAGMLQPHDAYQRGISAGALSNALDAVRGRCGPSALPPHALTAARLERALEALRSIAGARVQDRTDPEALDWLRGMARIALEELSR